MQNLNSDTPLIIASLNGNKEVILELLRHKIDLDTQNQDGYTALMAAANEGYLDVVNLLLEKGANADIQSYEEGFTALMWAIQNGNYKVAERIIKYQPNLELTDSLGRSALLIAFGNENINIIDLLIKSGAEIYSIPFNVSVQKDQTKQILPNLPNYSTDDFRSTEMIVPALTICAIIGKKNIVKHFIDCGINIDAIDSLGNTSLIWASQSSNLDIVSLLLDSGADCNIQNHNGETALIYAAIYENIEIVSLLLKSGANVDLQDRNGFKAVDMTTNATIKKILYAHMK